MFDLDQLLQKNHDISELSRVLAYLIRDRLICDTETTCELFFDYVKKVNDHMDFGNQNFYRDLLVHQDNHVRNLASGFMNGSAEVRRVFNQYTKKWCNTKMERLQLKEHDLFIQETDEIFELVLARIQDEQEKLYPVLRNIWALEEAA